MSSSDVFDRLNQAITGVETTLADQFTVSAEVVFESGPGGALQCLAFRRGKLFLDDTPLLATSVAQRVLVPKRLPALYVALRKAQAEQARALAFAILDYCAAREQIVALRDVTWEHLVLAFPSETK